MCVFRSTLAKVMIRRSWDLLDPIPAVRHVGCPRDVIVSLDNGGQPLGQVRIRPHQPLLALCSLGIGHVPVEPPLDDGLEPPVHRLGHLRVRLLRPQQRLALVEDVVLVQHVANLVVVHVQPELFPIVDEVVLVPVTAG